MLSYRINDAVLSKCIWTAKENRAYEGAASKDGGAGIGGDCFGTAGREPRHAEAVGNIG